MNTIFKITTVVFLLLNKNINGQSALPAFQWTKPDGEGQYDYGYGIATDSMVGWQLPNGALERPIPGTRLSPFGVPLSVNVILPMSNSSFNVGSIIAIQAAESGGTGTIQKVEFFSGNTKLGEDLTSPYNYSWTNAATGLYSITAKVTDSGNNTTVSPSININVTNSFTATIISPINNGSFNFGSAIAIQTIVSGGTFQKSRMFC